MVGRGVPGAGVPHPLKTERRSLPRRVAHWLFIKGGMSLVFLLGLMAFGLIEAVLCLKSTLRYSNSPGERHARGIRILC